MNRNRIITLADAVESVRPEWSHAGIVNHLSKLEQTWTGTDAELAAHAMAVAANPRAMTPGAFNIAPPPGIQQHTPDDPLERESRCYICGELKSACHKRQDFEITHGLPDPHVFETEEDAMRNTAQRTPEERQQLRQQIRTLIRNVNDEVKA